MNTDPVQYRFATAEPSHMHRVFVPSILARLGALRPRRVLDLGCGNGSLCRIIKDAGFTVEGADPSEEGIQHATNAFPDISFRRMSIYDDAPADWLHSFDVIINTEVVEHLYDPRALPKSAADLLTPGGRILVTTPYHGYLKNLALCLAGRWDHHHNPLWDHGHIKFWSPRTLAALFEEQGFVCAGFKGLGRLPWLWMTMLMEFTRNGNR